MKNLLHKGISLTNFIQRISKFTFRMLDLRDVLNEEEEDHVFSEYDIQSAKDELVHINPLIIEVFIIISYMWYIIFVHEVCKFSIYRHFITYDRGNAPKNNCIFEWMCVEVFCGKSFLSLITTPSWCMVDIFKTESFWENTSKGTLILQIFIFFE